MKEKNAKILSSYLGEDHGCLTLWLTLEGDDFYMTYGGYCLGYFCDSMESYKKDYTGSVISELLKTLDLQNYEQLVNKYVRVRFEGGGTIGDKIIAVGNLIEEKWFSFKDFFEKNKNTETSTFDTSVKKEPKDVELSNELFTDIDKIFRISPPRFTLTKNLEQDILAKN